MSAPLLTVRDLTLVYGAGNNAMPVLHRVSFDIRRGDRFIILGRSGCGKSTLLKAIAGFLRPRSGQIELDGKSVTAPGTVLPPESGLFQPLLVPLNWQ